MKCVNCGSESNFEWATFCRNCQQPLRAEMKAVAAHISELEITSKLDNSDMDKIEKDGPAIEENTGAEGGVGDPMDYIMGAKSSASPPGVNDILESIRPEPVEHELTLYRDNDVKLSVSPETERLTVEALNDNIKITSALMPEEEPIPEEISDEEPGVVSLALPAVDSKPIEGVKIPEPPKEHSTQKIQIPTASDQVEVQPSVQNDSVMAIPSAQILNEIKQSRGVIYFSGKNLKLTGGAKVVPGDEIKINEKTFEIKRQPGRSRLFYIGVSAITAVIILSCLAIFTLSSNDIGQLIGTVAGADGRPLIGQGVKIAELNRSVSTNEAGFFIFGDIPAGIYTLNINTPGGGRIQDRISVVKNQITTIALSDLKAEEMLQTNQTPQQTENRPADITRTDAKAGGKGTLRLILSPSNASAFVDNKPLGVGSNSYKLDPGSYTLTIRKSGFEDSDKKIRIDSDKILSVNVSLAEETQTRVKGNLEAANEFEAAGNYREAQRYFDLALKSNPRDIIAMLGKARCARADGKLDDALTSYMQASRIAGDKGDANSQLLALTGVIEIRPNTFTAYNSRGELLYNQGRYDKAADDFAHVVEIDNRNLSAYYKLGDCFYRSGKYSDAVNAFSAAKELNFADPKAGVWLTKTYLAMGDKKNAKKAYENFKEIASYSARLEYKRDPEWQKVLAALGEKE